MARLSDVADTVVSLYADLVGKEMARSIDEQLFGTHKPVRLSKKQLEKMRLEHEEKDKAVKKVEKLMEKLDVSLSDLGYDYD